MELREYKRLANALKMQDSTKYSTWDNIMQLCLNMYEDMVLSICCSRDIRRLDKTYIVERKNATL